MESDEGSATVGDEAEGWLAMHEAGQQLGDHVTAGAREVLGVVPDIIKAGDDPRPLLRSVARLLEIQVHAMRELADKLDDMLPPPPA